MTSPFIQGLLAKTAPAETRKPSLPALAPTAAATQFGGSSKRYNPFLTALNHDSPEFKEVYGVNRPLPKPMLLGHRDDQPLYGGSRLFILY